MGRVVPCPPARIQGVRLVGEHKLLGRAFKIDAELAVAGEKVGVAPDPQRRHGCDREQMRRVRRRRGERDEIEHGRYLPVMRLGEPLVELKDVGPGTGGVDEHIKPLLKARIWQAMIFLSSC